MARDPYRYFRVEAKELTQQLGQSVLELERDSSGEVVNRLLRLAHTLKGAARVVKQPGIADEAHSIEDLLTPLRDKPDVVPRESIEAMLHLLDSISGKVVALGAPAESAAPTSPASTAALPEETFRIVRGDTAEMDELLDGLTEANTQLRGLREIAALAARARNLADRMTEQVAIPRASGADLPAATRSAAEDLRALAVNIERGLTTTHERIERELRDVREAAEQLKLVPAGALFPALERTARDSAQILGKDVTFTGSGADIRLDAEIMRQLQDALLQLVRNAVAHGIEPRRDRIAAGKPATGTIRVSVTRHGRQIVFACEDDGKGIDIPALRTAAIRAGRNPDELKRLDPGAELLALLRGGVSTAAVVSEVSGRGIGMDIVREAVARMGADFNVRTEPGKFTRFELSVPLSVSSVEALIVEAMGSRVTLPLYAVRRTTRLEPGDIHRTGLGDSIIHEGQSIPLVPLARLLGRSVPPRRAGNMTAAIVSGRNGVAAVAITRLLGSSGIVFRQLPALAPATLVVAGASFDADGNPMLMLDPDGIVDAALKLGETSVEAGTRKVPILVIDDSLTTRMLEQSILESAGYDVDVAVSAEDGLEQARRRDYSLILCDVEMPGMDGFAFVESIRRDPHLRDIPAILVTSRNAPEDKQRGRAVGAQDYVVKSEFDQAVLLDRIRELVT